MWFNKDYRWMLPVMGLLFIAMIVVTQWPKANTWYDSKEIGRIKTMPVAELASWVIQGRNDYVSVVVSTNEIETIDNIPGLIHLQLSNDITPQLEKIPIYKKLVLILPNGIIPTNIFSTLTENWKRKIIILNGGVSSWNTKITSESIDDLSLSLVEEKTLAEIRPFFHRSLMETNNFDEDNQQERYLAPETTLMPMLEDEEEEEKEEGC